ncbi:MAG: daunorubicin ABC transporter ATP-binding protein [Chloroflexi bacterium]|nr:daunorubicin ABC transporter ATP-binding protein [Chloroflexota bacterium]
MKNQKNINLLEVSQLYKSFGNKKILENISFEMGKGEFVLITGSNGSGKTTLIRIISSLCSHDEGEIKIFQTSLKKEFEIVKSKIGFGMHNSMMYDDFTGKENLEYSSDLYGITNKKGNLKNIVDRFELTEILDKKIKYLSQGQIKRIANAKAFLNNPKLIILDEPDSGLDKQSQEILFREIIEEKKLGTSILLASHRLEKWIDIADQVLFMKNSSLINVTKDRKNLIF